MNSSAPPDLGRQRQRTFLRGLAWLGLYLFVAVLAVGANPFRDQTTGPFDLLAYHKGWNPDGGKVEVRHRERSDIVDVAVPEWMEGRRQIREGIVPLWNPLPAGGHPALFSPITSELTPAFAIFTATKDPALGFYFAVLSSLVIAGLGMHLLVARYRSTSAAVFSGVSYMLCGFIAGWLFWPHTYTAIWIPWMLMCIDRIVRDGSRGGFVGLALCTALMFLGGFPFVIALGLGAALVFTVFCAASRGRGLFIPKTMAVLSSIALGMALCAIPILTLEATISESELGYRHGGSPFRLARHARQLLGPWLDGEIRVESSMYVGVLALAFALVGGLSLLRRRPDALTSTALCLLVVGGSLTFGLLPREIGDRLPVLSSNIWSRAILLLDIGLILLATTGMDWLLRDKRRIGWMAASVLVCTLQGADLMAQFRKFNGPTRSEYFYHVSPALAFLKQRVRPFQYVAQDSPHFMISGTLTAVGLGDWFAHSLRTPALRGLLQDLAQTPFKTSTATMVGIENYKWEADIADIAGMCYAIYPSVKENAPILMRATTGPKAPLKLLNNATVQQELVLAQALRVSAVGLKVATYQATGLDGQMTVSMLRQPDGRAIARATVPGSSLGDNVIVAFRFPQAVEAPAGTYLLDVRYVPGPKNKRLTAWTFKNGKSGLQHNGTPVAGTMDYLLYGPAAVSPLLLFQKNGVSITENPGCAEGAFWLDKLDDPKGSMRKGHVRLVRYRPHDFAFEVDGPRAGFVLVPMRYQRGWRATVDGRPVRFALVRGLLPAVEVPAGHTRVRMTYRPPYWPLGLTITGLAVAFLAWFGWRRRARAS